jgi:predicted PP-loop superfamily ATPase
MGNLESKSSHHHGANSSNTENKNTQQTKRQEEGKKSRIEGSQKWRDESAEDDEQTVAASYRIPTSTRSNQREGA